MIRLCIALLTSGATLAPLSPVPVTLATEPPAAPPVACVREYEALPLSQAAGARPGERSALSMDVVDRYVANYAREYRATVASTPNLGRPFRTAEEWRLRAQHDRVTFLMVMVALNMFDRYYVDLAHPAYAACVRAHIVNEVEKLPPGGGYELPPAPVITMFETGDVTIGPWPLPALTEPK